MLGIAIDSAAMGMWSIDLQTREFVPSHRLKEIFGFHRDEQMTYEAAIGQIDSKPQALVTDAVEANINQGIKCDVEYPLRGFHDGKLHWVRANGDLSSMIGIISRLILQEWCTILRFTSRMRFGKMIL